MASLVPDAQAVRLESARLRTETRALKHTLRASAARSREQLDTAESVLTQVLARRDEPLPSPWSNLCWSHQDDSVEHALVPLP